MVVLWSDVSVKHSRPNIQCEKKSHELNEEVYRAGEPDTGSVSSTQPRVSQDASPVTVGNPQRTPNLLNIYLMQRRNDIVERIQFCLGNVLSKKRKEKKMMGKKECSPRLL